MKVFKSLLAVLISLSIVSCGDDSTADAEFTGNEVRLEMIPGTVQGNTTTGTLVIKEKSNGQAQLEITLNNALSNADHPVHLHFGSLDDDGEVALLLGRLRESNGIGSSTTILNALDDNTEITYSSFLNFDGSIKIHFEDSGPLENEILGAVNVGINRVQNQAYLDGIKSITVCNSEFKN
ncbi:hypothetical protein [Roseivirga misakiensis]|uniref:CHRD domain-containing protein n=1 Tax=Roseivirga misakiensis TaxID=1563681 RepID=A0A1E5T0J5_9BACT|nr:hypothetical protein [Roseivirga misakiensis]OEK04900.1 hypothetical protein BFP71_15795 [Roseivirga misakiensis]